MWFLFVSGKAPYVRSQGVCRGGNSPEYFAGQTAFNDTDCKQRCDLTDTCSGYALVYSAYFEKYSCTTYTSFGASGVGSTGATCYMKKQGILLDPTLHIFNIKIFEKNNYNILFKL